MNRKGNFVISKKFVLPLIFLLLLFTVACENESTISPYSFIEILEDIESVPLDEEIPSNIATSNHAFVVLGYGLSEDGEMQDPLLERLRVAKNAGDKNENSKFIVTGGVPKNGKTEADVMFDWLIDQGIDENRIIKENQSRDTVENALYTMEVVEEEMIESLTLITSASHMRRALMLFLEADKMNKVSSHIVHMDIDKVNTNFIEGEKEFIQRDLNRIIDLLDN